MSSFKQFSQVKSHPLHSSARLKITLCQLSRVESYSIIIQLGESPTQTTLGGEACIKIFVDTLLSQLLIEATLL